MLTSITAIWEWFHHLSCVYALLPYLSAHLFIAVIRQQFLLGINCSIFLYWNSYGANQCLALTWKSFRIAHTHSVQFSRSSREQMFCSNGLTPCMLCVQIFCVLCVLDHYLNLSANCGYRIG